jgi:hypothetical protein
MLQLNPPIPMVTPRGEGMAVLVSDYGPDFDLLWTVIIGKGDHAGEIWTYPNPQVRGVANFTMGRPRATKPDESVDGDGAAVAHRNGSTNGRAATTPSPAGRGLG